MWGTQPVALDQVTHTNPLPPAQDFTMPLQKLES